jgi:hypothetical protein
MYTTVSISYCMAWQVPQRSILPLILLVVLFSRDVACSAFYY